jgi:ABC-type branched-subunit amino acid transport system substrate-binding protein
LEKKGARRRRAAVGRKGRALAVFLLILVAGVAVYAALAPASHSAVQCPSTGGSTFTSSTIKIGYLTELSGNAVSDGYAARIGAELAVNQTNAAGGVDGKAVDLVVLDAQTNPQTAVQGAETLVQQDGVLAITGPTDQGDALAVSGYAETCGIPFVASTVPSAALVAPGSNWTVSVEPDAVQWGAAVAKYVSQTIPDAKIALMTQNADQQKEMSAGVRWYANTYKNESIVFDQVYANSQFPWATAATAVKFSSANAVIVSWLPTLGFSQANVIEALLSAGFQKSQIFVVSADNQISDLGNTATGVRGATLFDSAIAKGYPNASAFVTQLQPFVNGTLSSNDYCGVCPTDVGPNYYYAYLGMQMMINAIQNVLSSGQALTRQDFMSSMKHASIQDGLGNTLSIDPSGSSVGNFYIVMVGALNGTETNYPLSLIERIEFAPGVVPSYELAKTA